MQDICDKVLSSHSHNIHKVICFEPFAPAALFMRIVLTMVASNKFLSVSYSALLVRGALCIMVSFFLGRIYTIDSSTIFGCLIR